MENHSAFFGTDGNDGAWSSNKAAIERRFPGQNYRVYCGHCGVNLCGLIGNEGPIIRIIWRKQGGWFGSFEVDERLNS